MKRDERKDDFVWKNVWEPSSPPDESAQNVSKKNPCRTNFSLIFLSKVQNHTVFSIIYMIRIRFFGLGELNSEGVSGGTVRPFEVRWPKFKEACSEASIREGPRN